MYLPHQGKIPGYAGFVPGRQHIAGVSEGKLTRTAESQQQNGTLNPTRFALPPSPIRTSNQEEEQTAYRLPGYTGFIPGT